MDDGKHTGHDDGREHKTLVPKSLLLVYAVILAVFVYYLFTGLKFGPSSPTGF